MYTTKLPKVISAEDLLYADSAYQVDYPRITSSWVGPVCWPQQGGQKLADAVAMPTGCTG